MCIEKIESQFYKCYKTTLYNIQGTNIPKSRVNNENIQINESFQNILLTTINEYSRVKMIEENSLHFQEPFEDWIMEVVEDKKWANALMNRETLSDEYTSNNEDLSYELKRCNLFSTWK